MTQFTHKGYIATIKADPGTGLLHGEATNARALLTFAGCSMDEVKKAFEEAIDDYEEWSRGRYKASETPRSLLTMRKADRRRLTPAKI